MLGRRGNVLAVAVATGLLTTACHSSGNEALGHVTGTAPVGTHRVTCEVHSGHGGTALALDLPKGYQKAHVRGADCAWSTSVDDPEAASDLGRVRADLVVTVDHVSGDHTLREVYDDEAPDAVKGDDPENDDSILHLRLSTDVATFGHTHGDRLSWWCFCDGQNTITRMVQADGVRLTWTGVRSREALVDRSLATALRRAGRAAS
jgi:hypothetical protein